METRSNPTGQASSQRPLKDRILKNYSRTLDPVLQQLPQLVVHPQPEVMQVAVSLTPLSSSLCTFMFLIAFVVLLAKKEEKKKEEEPEEEMDMGGLFGDDY